MAGLYPLSRMQQFDSNGQPLSGARLLATLPASAGSPRSRSRPPADRQGAARRTPPP
jgi:hypothetical protein